MTTDRAPQARVRRGTVASLSGAMAEEQVARHYLTAGYQVIGQRWRGRAGEIDLICRKDRMLVFIEVKRTQSHALAAGRLQRSQMNRICHTACEYCGTQSDGQMTEMRFDVALVDSLGRIEIVENAFTG